MKIVNYSELRANLKKYLDEVENDGSKILVKRSKSGGVVIGPMADDYQSLVSDVNVRYSTDGKKELRISIHPDDMDSLGLGDYDIDLKTFTKLVEKSIQKKIWYKRSELSSNKFFDKWDEKFASIKDSDDIKWDIMKERFDL